MNKPRTSSSSRCHQAYPAFQEKAGKSNRNTRSLNYKVTFSMCWTWTHHELSPIIVCIFPDPFPTLPSLHPTISPSSYSLYYVVHLLINLWSLFAQELPSAAWVLVGLDDDCGDWVGRLPGPSSQLISLFIY